MSARDTTKIIARNVVSFSVSFTVGNVLSSNARPKNKLQEAEIWLGSTAVGMMAGSAASKKTDAFVDALFDVFEGTRPVSTIVP